MAEYIEREALLAAYDAAHEGAPGRARKLIADAPAVDVVHVIHGRYIPDQRYQGVGNCGLCGGIVTILNNYCPNCGARMDGE